MIPDTGWWQATEEPLVMRCVDLFERMVMEEDPDAGARVELVDEGDHFSCRTYCRHKKAISYLSDDAILPSIEMNAYAHEPGQQTCSAFLMRRVFAYREAFSRCALDVGSRRG